MRLYVFLLLQFFTVILFAQKGIPKFETYLKPFYHGVASGDPLQDRVIIWTRYTPTDETTTEVFEIQWEVAEDLDFSNIVKSGVTDSKIKNDFTVKVDVKGLDAGAHYYYRFISPEGVNSLIGRTKTAATGTLENLRLAVVSCSSIFSGYFNAYRRIAERGDLDAVIHLGDYIYDFIDQDERVRVPVPEPKKVYNKEEFRAMHNYYKLDQDMMVAHQQHPWIIIWDNHDIGKENDEDPEEFKGTMKAFYEWTPTRVPDSNKIENIYRSFHFGDLLDLYMTDILVHKDANLSFPNPAVNDANRTMLGSEQFDWLMNELDNSTAKWRIMGGQKQMGQFMLFGLPEELAQQLPGIGTGLFFNSKGWDGYPAERNKILQKLRSKNLNNNIHVSGDIHMYIGMDLVENPFDPILYKRASGKGAIGGDFCPSSVSRGGIDETLGFYPAPDLKGLINNTIKDLNPHFRYFNGFDHGYGLLDIRPGKTTGEFWSSPILRPTGEERFLKALVMYDGDNHWAREQVEEPTVPLNEFKPLAPFIDTTSIVSSNEQFLSTFSLISELYPQPLTDISFLDIIPASAQKLNVSLFDYTGKKLATIFSAQVEKNTSYRVLFDQSKLRLPKGVYFISLSNELGVAHKKLMVH